MSRIPCPYCSQIVEASAVACSTCGGLLTIGSPMAIRQALAADPTLSLKDPDSVARLKEFVLKIDESLSKSNREKLEAEIQRVKDEKESLRLQQEALKAKELEEKRSRKAYLDSLPSFKRFLIVRRVPIIALLLLLSISAVVIPNQITKSREAASLEKKKEEAAVEKANKQASVASSAAENISLIESQYCSLLAVAIQDPMYQQYERNWTVLSEAERDIVKENYIIGLRQLYTEYTSIGVDLGSERPNYLSPILELHSPGLGYPGGSKTAEVLAKCSVL